MTGFVFVFLCMSQMTTMIDNRRLNGLCDLFQGFDDGIGTLMQSSLCRFPLTFDEPMNLLIALTKAGHDSALQVGPTSPEHIRAPGL